MIYEVTWDTDGTDPCDLELPKYVIVSNSLPFNPKTKECYPDPPVFHIMPSDYPDFDPEEELVDLLTEIFDWCVSSVYIAGNEDFNKDMEFFAKNGFVKYEYQ